MAAVCHSGVSPCRPAAPGSTIDASDTGRCAMLHMLTRRWWLFVLRGVAAMLFGIFAIVWPGATLLVLVILWGAYALVDGAIAVGIAAAARDAPRQGRLVFGLLGLAGILAGVVAWLWPGVTALALLWI